MPPTPVGCDNWLKSLEALWGVNGRDSSTAVCPPGPSRRGRLSIVAGVVLLMGLGAPVEGQQSQVDYAFLVDVSGSMAGGAGHPNIFPRVRSAVKEFISALEPGTTLFFLPFADSIREIRSFSIQAYPDTVAVMAYVDALVANGDRTAVFNSIEAALRTVNTYRETRDRQRAVVFFVYTDGDDNVSSWSLAQILDHFNLARGENDWLYYTELGLQRDPAKEALFGRAPHAELVREPEGEVRPIQQVEASLPFLNFGNLQETKSSARIQRFVVRSRRPLPDSFTVVLEAQFPDVAAQGTLVDISPHRFRPEGDVQWVLTLKNPVEEGSYSGSIQLLSDDPRVLVVPNVIEATFIVAPPRSVAIRPADGRSLPLDLGTYVSGTPDSAVSVGGIALDFDQAARSGNEELALSLEAADDNPGNLVLGRDLLIAGLQSDRGVIHADVSQVDLHYAPATRLTPGQYLGYLVLRSSTLVISGEGLERGSDSTTVRVPWALTVSKAPLPKWAWALLLLAAGALAYGVSWYMRRPPTFADLHLVVTAPIRDQVDLSGKSSVELGRGGGFLKDVEAKAVIRASHEGRRPTALLEVAEGRVLIERPGQRGRIPAVAVEEVVDGDVLVFEGAGKEYHVRVSSFTLARQ